MAVHKISLKTDDYACSAPPAADGALAATCAAANDEDGCSSADATCTWVHAPKVEINAYVAGEPYRLKSTQMCTTPPDAPAAVKALAAAALTVWSCDALEAAGDCNPSSCAWQTVPKVLPPPQPFGPWPSLALAVCVPCKLPVAVVGA